MLLAPALLLAGAVMPAADAAAPLPTCLIGQYDGGAMEMAARLELSSDGRFRYVLSYGAIDEGAEGRWQGDDNAVTLTSDETVAPRFALVSDMANADQVIRVRLDLPRGLSPQYFAASIAFADASRSGRQFSDEVIELPAGLANPATSVRIMLPIFDLSSDAIALASGGGRDLTVRFEPNDLGSVAFAQTPLARRDGDLVLERHGREVRFRQVAGPCRRKPGDGY
jgi:hypothetical protein